jgi:tetratricopeptide (TPR) repeat protein
VSDSDTLLWEASYPEALDRARRERKLLVVHFMSPERPLCKAMSDETLSSPEVMKISRAYFVSVRLDARDHDQLFDKLVGGNGLLATSIVDGTEDVVAVLPGFADVRTYLDFLESARSGIGRLLELRAQARSQRRSAALGLALAEGYDKMGSPRRAEDEYTTVETLAKSMPSSRATNGIRVVCHERLARLLIAKGRTADARAELERALELDPSRANRPDRLLLTEGLVLSAERRLTDAARCLADLIQRFVSSSECEQALFALGSIEHELRDDAGAIGHLELLLRDHPTSRWCAPALQQIAHIRNPQPDHRH